MIRWIVTAVIVSLISPSVASAGESLLSSATKIVQEAVRKDLSAAKDWSGLTVARPTASGQTVAGQEGHLLMNPKLSRRTKWLLGLGLAAGFVGSVYAIAGNSENITPSSRGTRTDGCSCW